MIGTLQYEVVIGPPLWKCEDGGKGEEYGEFDGRSSLENSCGT